MSRADAQPPRWARRALTAALGRTADGRATLDDLDHEFRERAAIDSRAARHWYRREAPGVLWRSRGIRRGAADAFKGDPFMRRIAIDILRAVRVLRQQPRFTVVAALTLAVGIGGVTTIFSIVNGVLLKPLPFPDADRLVNVWSHSTKLGYPQFPSSPDLFFLFEKEPGLFDSMALSQNGRVNMLAGDTPQVVDSLSTTHTYFATLGTPVARGRSFTAAEDVPGGPRVAVISHQLWNKAFGADPAAVGRSVRIDGDATEIIGVAPDALDGPGAPDIYVPARHDRKDPIQGSFGFNAIGRLKPGVKPEAAAARLTAVALQAGAAVSSPAYRAFLAAGSFDVQIHLQKEDMVGDLRRPLWIVLGTVAMLLVIACANVANLFLVRAEGRQLEIAVRVALGASRAALVRALLIEALVLSALGSALGLVAARVGLPALLRLAPPTIPRLDQVSVDLRVVAFAAGVAVLASLLFGLLPALRYTRPRSMGVLRYGARGSDEPGRRRARHALVVAQTAIAVVLLVGSGLLARSFAKLSAANPGFDSRDVMTFRVELPETQYKDDATRLAFTGQLIERLSALPGVTRAGAVTMLPIDGGASGTAHEFDGQPLTPGALPPIVHYKSVAGDYFGALRIPVLEGRTFSSGDFAADARTVVVNQALADQTWPGQDPVGKRVRRYTTPSAHDSASPWFTVIGVVGSERSDGLRQPARPLLYYAGRMPDLSVPNAFSFAVRGQNLSARTEDLRRTVWALDRGLPVAALRSMDDIVSTSIVEFTFTMLTLALASVMALFLGAVGLYGVLSYAVLLRTREIGVRLALGATPGVVMRSVVTTGTMLAAIGLALGLAGAAALTRFMGDLLFETTPLDPLTFAAMGVTMLAVAVLASYLPARRAAHVSPLESMKAS